MAGSVEGAGFWLPSEFFDDFDPTDKINLDKSHAADEFCFPTEFPYDFEITTGQNNNEKRRVLPTSPQSTLSHQWSFSARSASGSSNGSPNGMTSPPATNLGARNDAVEELIYRAVGQVANLKLNFGDVSGPDKYSSPPKRLDQLYPASNKPRLSVFHNIYQKQGSAQMYQGWSVQKNPTRTGSSDPSGMKRECAGTGVFLPRTYGNISNDCANNAYSADSHQRTGEHILACLTSLVSGFTHTQSSWTFNLLVYLEIETQFSGYSSTPYIPERNVHALNKNFDRINGYVPFQPQFQPKFNPGFVSEYVFDGSEECATCATPTKFVN
ncbi:hypothetical protein CASFOL_001870 [Castilleja foliolosa]|uniref:Uncharacterized protein n=1 Tax=Castilleja foliolosa TaxID=1961234 RepID=A0ABD3EGP0_9LAMI